MFYKVVHNAYVSNEASGGSDVSRLSEEMLTNSHTENLQMEGDNNRPRA